MLDGVKGTSVKKVNIYIAVVKSFICLTEYVMDQKTGNWFAVVWVILFGGFEVAKKPCFILTMRSTFKLSRQVPDYLCMGNLTLLINNVTLDL